MAFKFVYPKNIASTATKLAPATSSTLSVNEDLGTKPFTFVTDFSLTDEYNRATQEPDKQGFLETLKSPFELWRYNSLPVAAYQIASGETKGKQAQESFDWLQSNPDIKSGDEYDYHSAMYERYGYTLSTQPFSFNAVIESAKSNPGMFTGELVNSVVADPYLLIPWFWGGWAVKAAQATKIGMKVASVAPMATKGTLTAAAATPTLATYSTINQLSETGELNLPRIQGEVLTGGIAAFGIGMWGAGASNKASKILGLSHDEVSYKIKKGIDKLAQQGDPWAQRIIKDSKDGVKVFDDSLQNILDDIETSDLNINLKDIDIKTTTKEWKNSKYKNVFDDLNDYVGFKKELNKVNANKKYNKLPDDVKDRKARIEYINKKTQVNKVKEAMLDEIMPDVRNSYNQMLLGGVQKYFKIQSLIDNKALLKSIETMGAVGLAGGIGYYLSNPKDGAFWNGFATAAGAVGLWKTGGALYARHRMLKQGNKLVTSSSDEIANRLKEIKTDLPEGVKLEDIGLASTPEFYTNPNIKKADIRRLGRAEEIQLAKGEIMTGYLLDGYRSAVQISAIDSNRMKEVIISKVPDIKRREAITAYLQEDVKTTKLSATELEVANDIRKVLNEMWKVTQGTELKFDFFKNYLPQYWKFSKAGGDNLADPTLSESLKKLILDTSKRENTLSGKTISEMDKFFPSYKAGIQAGLEPLTLDVADIMTRYINSTTRALAQRRLVNMIATYRIPGRNDGLGNNAKLMYNKLPTGLAHPEDYVQFYHPAFIKGLTDPSKYTKKQLLDMSPYVLREAAPTLRMLFDARTDGAIFRAISSLNFLQKRFSVGYSFFHAETLINNMMFTGFRPVYSIQTGLSATGLGNIFKHLPGGKMIVPQWENTSARAMLKSGGHYDMLKAATKAGVEFSHPDDIPVNRFFNMFKGAQSYLDNKIPYAGYLAKQGIEYAVIKPFQYIDRVTWDRVFNVGKLYAFQTNLIKLMDDPKLADIPLRIKMQRAATATNDMYGGLNWMQLYRDTTDPFLRELKKHAYTPKGRRYMQLGLFAPDWTTANFRVLASAMPGIGKDPMARKLYQAYALRAGIILATGGSALQYMFTGKTLWQNDDPTRVDLGNGYSLTLSKQYFEPLHWATAPLKTALSKQGSTLKLAEQFFFNKQYLTSPWPSPISKADVFSLQRLADYAGQAAMSMVPFGFRKIVEEIVDGDKITIQEAVGVLLGNLGHPMYKNPRKPKYPGFIEFRDSTDYTLGFK